MIPTRRRNPWRPFLWLLLVLWAVALVVNRVTESTASGWVALVFLVALFVLSQIERRYEDESVRIVTTEVYGRDQESAWSRGFDAGVVTERRRHQR